MDKNTKFNANNIHRVRTRAKVFPVPKGRQEIHNTYGLWICKAMSRVSYMPRNTIHPRAFKFYSLSHMIDGDGWYWNAKSNSITALEAGQGILVSPDFVHFYSAYRTKYTEDAVCFCGNIADSLYRSGIIKDGILDIGKSRKLLTIIEYASSPSRDSQIKANAALQALLTELYFSNRDIGGKSNLTLIEELLEKITGNQEKSWTVYEMAEFCNFSINHFRRIFLHHTGINPKLYIDTVKMNRASEMLLSTENHSITRIAELLGYNDQYHFSRRFKEITGVSPINYIKNNLNIIST